MRIRVRLRLPHRQRDAGKFLTLVLVVSVFVFVLYFRRRWTPESALERDLFRKELNNYPFQFKINPRRVCEFKRPQILFVVFCRAEGFEARSAVRESWGRRKDILVRNSTLAFLIGLSKNESHQRQIMEESKEFQDIIQADFVDSYHNLTLKAVVMLRWVASYCQNIEFLFKIDDDVHIDVDHLLAALTGRGPKFASNFVVGTMAHESPSIRQPGDKWFVSQTDFAGDFYPDYVLGMCYGISRDLIPKLYVESQLLPLFRFEDIYLTGMLLPRTKGKLWNNPDMNGHSEMYDRCRHPTKIIRHGFSPKELTDFHAKYSDPAVTLTCNSSWSWLSKLFLPKLF